MTLETLTRYLTGCEVVVGKSRSEYSVMWPNLTRRGLSFVYADTRLHYMLSGTEPAHALHAQTVAEIREEYPDADEREIKLRVAFRESIGMTREEENGLIDRISKALS